MAGKVKISPQDVVDIELAMQLIDLFCDNLDSDPEFVLENLRLALHALQLLLEDDFISDSAFETSILQARFALEDYEMSTEARFLLCSRLKTTNEELKSHLHARSTALEPMVIPHVRSARSLIRRDAARGMLASLKKGLGPGAA